MAQSQLSHLLVTGGTGFIGEMLTPLLIAKGYRVTLLSRNPERNRQRFPGVNFITDLNAISSIDGINGVINLAGEGVLDKRWSATRKQQLLDSRVTLTSELIANLKQQEKFPAVFISGSAVGYYGDAGNSPCTAASSPGQGFEAALCQQWEQAAEPAKNSGSRLVLTRIGIVLDGNGGALKRMLLPFKLGLGGKIGSGEQWFPWIHRQDLCKLIIFLLENPTSEGAYNATAPEPVTNLGFTQALGKTLKRPTLLPMPAFVLRLALGEAANLLLGGQHAKPRKALADGFQFEFTRIEPCLRDCLGKKP